MMLTIDMLGTINTTSNYKIRLVNKNLVNVRGRLRGYICSRCDKLTTLMSRGNYFHIDTFYCGNIIVSP